MPLPKRAAPYIVSLLLIVLAILAAWMFRAVSSPELQKAIREKRSAETAR